MSNSQFTKETLEPDVQPGADDALSQVGSAADLVDTGIATLSGEYKSTLEKLIEKRAAAKNMNIKGK